MGRIGVVQLGESQPKDVNARNESDLARVCYYLHKHNVQFLVIGAYACALHGHIRATQDIDILIQNNTENIEKSIDCIRELYPDLKIDLTAEDFRSNIVIKILDEPELDISVSAWSVTYEKAKEDIQTIVLDNVEIPFAGLRSLIESKDTTREQDIWDVRILNEIQRKKGG